MQCCYVDQWLRTGLFKIIYFYVWKLFQREETTVISHTNTQICYFIQNRSNYSAYRNELANITKTVLLCDVREYYYRLCSSETRFNGSIKIRTIQFPYILSYIKFPLFIVQITVQSHISTAKASLAIED